jgi:hypothetical protein
MNPNRGSVSEVIGSTQGRLDLYPIYIFIDILTEIHFQLNTFFLSILVSYVENWSGGQWRRINRAG